MGYEDQNQISTNIRLLIESHFNTASLEARIGVEAGRGAEALSRPRRGAAWRRPIGWSFKGGCISTSPRGSHDSDADADKRAE
jgi:hypothetical protein